ncbi:Uncharacterized conserved protein YjdB, contains Ig-like domain [Lachnospiraceae bacterium RM5]|nr:Uncharacterized conserved protein YjdB, contains Ig-like domain [Lachnospiraceae bacterium RM5]
MIRRRILSVFLVFTLILTSCLISTNFNSKKEKNVYASGEENPDGELGEENPDGELGEENPDGDPIEYYANVEYKTYVQKKGWQDSVRNGDMAGTSGENLRLEGIKIKLDSNYEGSIEYRAHVEKEGWCSWVKDDELAGYTSKGLRLEAIQINLTGEIAENYDVYYQTHIQKFGWSGWAKNGESSGSAGYGYRIEGICIKLVPKTVGLEDENNAKKFYDFNNTPRISYKTHVQKRGWQGYVTNGKVSGTSGKGLRLEAIRIKVSDNKGYSGGISYRTHVQKIGWQNYVSNDTLSGTSGKGLRLEAIQIKLTGELADNFDIYYRVSVQKFGWLGWAKNDGQAGSSGYGYRLEAIQICLVDKKGSLPSSVGGSVGNAFKKKVATTTTSSSGLTNDQLATIAKNSNALHRMYNPNSGEHFYTASYAERNSLISAGWKFEGTGWASPTSSSAPVYRVYNPKNSDHHYTMSLNEKNALVKGGWKYEGIAFYSDTAKRVPVYRLCNPKASTFSHHYTRSLGEKNALVAGGWRYEGIGWYAVQTDLPIEYDGSYTAIEADINMSGSGYGYNAKVVISSPSNGVVASFDLLKSEGITGLKGFGDDTCFYIENIMSNATQAGNAGKEYFYIYDAKPNKTYKTRIAWYDNDNTLRFFVNNVEVARTKTTMAKNASVPFNLGLEAGSAFNGNSVNALFSNVKTKAGNSSGQMGIYGNWDLTRSYFGFNATVEKQGSVVTASTPFNTLGYPTYGANIRIKGTANIPGNDATGHPWNWDTCFSARDPVTGKTNVPMSSLVVVTQKYGWMDTQGGWK